MQWLKKKDGMTDSSHSDETPPRLTGHQARFVRCVLSESRLAFAKRLGISHDAVLRHEYRADKAVSGPISIIIEGIAKQFNIPIPDRETFMRPNAAEE